MKKVLFFTLLVLLLAGCNTKPTNQENTIVVKTDIEERTGDELKIIAVIKVKPECIEDIKPIFQAVVTGSQEEEGCISYNLHQDIADSTKFVMVEEWKSQDAIDFHNNTEHYKTFKTASADMVAGLDVSIIKLVF
ncbi:MAG: putative quinol monooxygenase [Dysgonomonas sp.]